MRRTYTRAMDPTRQYSTWVKVDLGAIESNLSYFLESTQRQVMAVVKANAYGHGAIPVAQAARRAGASWLGVARVDEALELREAGIDGSILILGFTPPAQVERMVSTGISLAVWESDQIGVIAKAAEASNLTARLHLKVDTGMSRLGVQISGAIALAREIVKNPVLDLEGVFTHLARADETAPETTQGQLEAFTGVIDALEEAGLRPPLVHAANSAAGLAYHNAWFDLVRVGIAMYGLRPSAARPLPGVIRPALSWESTLAMVKSLPVGRGVSYGHEYITTREERIGTVPVGYADGYRRVPGNEVLIGGRKVPVIGRVTMDQIMVNLDTVPEARVGDEVVLLGMQGSERLAAEDIAGRWGTINYEVTSGIARRVQRIY